MRVKLSDLTIGDVFLAKSDSVGSSKENFTIQLVVDVCPNKLETKHLITMVLVNHQFYQNEPPAFKVTKRSFYLISDHFFIINRLVGGNESS